MDALRLVLYQLRLANWELLALFVRLVFDLLRVKRDFAPCHASNFKRAPALHHQIIEALARILPF